jgi:hypothetical protein
MSKSAKKNEKRKEKKLTAGLEKDSVAKAATALQAVRCALFEKAASVWWAP